MEKTKNGAAKIIEKLKSVKHIEIIIGLIVIAVLVIVFGNIFFGNKEEKAVETATTQSADSGTKADLEDRLSKALSGIKA